MSDGGDVVDRKLTREERERARNEADARPKGGTKGRKKNDDTKRKKGK